MKGVTTYTDEYLNLIEGIPVDWTIKRINDFADMIGGYSFSRESYNLESWVSEKVSNPVRLYRISDVGA